MKMRKSFLFILVAALLLSFAIPFSAEEEPEISQIPEPQLLAERAVIINSKTGDVLYCKNENSAAYCGFLPRVMTCLLLAEEQEDLSLEITVPSGVNAATRQKSSVGLSDGDKISLEDLLTAVLIGNSQEAAWAIALYLSNGNISSFVEKMNARAAALGAENTVFAEPAGYYQEGTKTQTTALDAAKIAAAAASHEILLAKSNTSTVYLTVNGKKRILYTRNALVDKNDETYSPYASGLSVHGDTRIGSSMASSNNSTGSRFIAVAISSKLVTDTFSDVAKMLEYAAKSFHTVTVLEKNIPIREIRVEQAKQKDTLVLISANEVQAMLPKNVKIEEVEQIVDLPESVTAPVEKGTELGSVTLKYNGVVYGSSPLIAQTGAELDLVKNYTERISEFFKKPVVTAAIIFLLGLLVVYIFLTYLKNKRRQKKKKITSHERVSFHDPDKK